MQGDVSDVPTEDAQPHNYDPMTISIDDLPMLEEDTRSAVIPDAISDVEGTTTQVLVRRRPIVISDDDTIDLTSFTPSGSSGYETIESASSIDLTNAFSDDDISSESTNRSGTISSESSDGGQDYDGDDDEWVPKRR